MTKKEAIAAAVREARRAGRDVYVFTPDEVSWTTSDAPSEVAERHIGTEKMVMVTPEGETYDWPPERMEDDPDAWLSRRNR